MILIFLLIIVSILCCLFAYWYKQESNKNIEKEILNYKIRQQNTEAEYEAKALLEQVQERQKHLDDLNQALENLKENNEKLADAAYKEYSEELEQEYNELFSDLFLHSRELEEQIKQEQESLNTLKEKQLAYLREQQRKEELITKKDFYRVVLNSAEIDDIKYLREMQNHISRKEVIDKIIWSGYYKPAYDILISHLLGKRDKVSGIYKITCLENGKVYIGQSSDIKTRFSDHLKSALSSSATTNKLYQEMRKYQPYNFTFEILEEVPRNKLDERERYWIDFYSTKEFGLNITKGNS